MRRNVLIVLCLIVGSIAVNSQSLFTSNFIVEANEWYFYNVSSTSFSTSIKNLSSQSLTIINDKNNGSENKTGQRSLTQMPIPDYVMDSFRESNRVKGNLQKYFQNQNFDQSNYQSKWYHGFTKTVGNLIGSAGTL